MSESAEFTRQCDVDIVAQGEDADLKAITLDWMIASARNRYTYHFAWQGRPIIQYPQDMIALQEVVWEVRPDLIIETGIAHGGSLVFSASLLAQLDMTEAIEAGQMINPRESRRKVLGIDIDIRAHNRAAIQAHPMASRIQMIQGSSVDADTIEQVRAAAAGFDRVLVLLDSNHTHEHVRAELEAYAPLTSVGSYCIVYDTLVEDVPAEMFSNRPWGPGDNPKTAVWDYLKSHPEFEIDRSMDAKLLISVAPDGYLRRIA